MSKVHEIINNAISLISPSWALERSQAQLAYESVRRYSGARQRKNETWFPANTDADSAIINDLPNLRARSRDLVRNNSWAASIIDSFVKYVVADGIELQASKEGAEESLREQLLNIDIAGNYSFYEDQALALRQMLIDGEAFIRLIIFGGRLRLQLIEADQIWSSSTSSQFGNEIHAGIEIDKDTGRQVAFYVNDHPGKYGSTTNSEVRVLAQDMIHLYMRQRPGQTRGVPILAPVINVLRDLGELTEAAIVSCRVAACISAAIKRQYHPTPQKDAEDKPYETLQPGMIAKLRPGEDIVLLDPKQPGEVFPVFTQLLLRSVAAGVGLSYETVSKNYSETNYNAARTSLLNERKTLKCMQQFLITHLCERIGEELQLLRFLRGEGSRKLKLYWQPPGFEWVDPEKEVVSQILAVQNNLATKSSIIAERGGDWREIMKQRKIEKDKENELGITPEPVNNKPTKSIVSDTSLDPAKNAG